LAILTPQQREPALPAAPEDGKNKTRRLWTYVRDQCPFAVVRLPAALFFYSVAGTPLMFQSTPLAERRPDCRVAQLAIAVSIDRLLGRAALLSMHLVRHARIFASRQHAANSAQPFAPIALSQCRPTTGL
jgi:hypothetical protein